MLPYQPNTIHSLTEKEKTGYVYVEQFAGCKFLEPEKSETLRHVDTLTLYRCSIHEYDVVTIGTDVSEEMASISGQSKSLYHKDNLESALNNRIANLSPSCVPQYNVQRFPSTCGTSSISIQELAVVLLRSEGRVKRRGERKVVACYVSISKSR